MSLRSRWTLWASAALLLLVFDFLMVNAWAQSPTMDEQNHIARGYALLRTGDPRLSVEHPPLVNTLEALPLLLLGRDIRLPLADGSWEAGEWYRFADLFLWHINQNPDRIVFLARLPVIVMTLLLVALAGRWARELWGAPAGVLAAALLALDPNLLAHGSLATTDVGVTFAATLAGYAVWRMRQAPSLRVSLLAGLAVGVMLASKTSAPMFWGVFGLMLVGDALRDGLVPGWQRKVGSRLALYAGVTAIALLVLWASYAFQVAPAIENGLSVPMGAYWAGIAAVFKNVQGGKPSYLLGKTILAGWPMYFPITFAVKTPLPTLLLLGLALPVTLARKRWRDALFLLLPVIVYGFFALRSSLNLGYRHLLPMLPFLYVWAAQTVTFNTHYVRHNARSALRILCFAFLGWLAIESFWIAPHFLAYFNPIGGGPENGWRIVADSNIDWGQDLKYLRDYLAKNNLGQIKLSWFGSSYPEAYGIAYEPLPGLPHNFNMWFEPPTFHEQQPEPGIYAISVSNLVELSLEDKHFFSYFRARDPDARIGYSIYLYEVGQP